MDFIIKEKGFSLNINSQTNENIDLQVGPTSLGMVRIYLATTDMGIPLDFTPEEADEIAEEIRLSAQKARRIYTD